MVTSLTQVDAFPEALRAFCVEGIAGPEDDGAVADVAAEVQRRAAVDALTLHDLRLVLLVAPADAVWVAARGAAWAQVLRQPAAARAVLLLHSQLEVWPPVDCREASTGGAGAGFEAVAATGLDREFTGPARRGPTKKEARERACTSLLARLAGKADPHAARSGPVLPAPRAFRTALRIEAFEALLARRLQESEPGEALEREVLARAGRQRLRHRDLCRLLFEAAGDAWQPAREAALAQVAAAVGGAAALLGTRTRELGAPAVRYEEERDELSGVYRITARVDVGGGLVAGDAKRALSRRTGRHLAAVSLLAAVTGLDDVPPLGADHAEPDPGRPELDRSRNPLMLLNELKTKRYITEPQWSFSARGLDFACSGRTCLTVLDGREVTASGTGRGKAQARTRAGDALIDALTPLLCASAPAPRAPAGEAASPPASDEPAHGDVAASPAVPAPPSPLQPATSAAPSAPPPEPPAAGVAPQAPAVSTADRAAVSAWVAEAFAAGCAVTLLPAVHPADARLMIYQADGRALPADGLPSALRAEVVDLALATPAPAGGGAHAAKEPEVWAAAVSGWTLPVAAALPHLLALADGVHASAAAWGAVARWALGLIAAGRVHPALADYGREVWQLDLHRDQAAEQFAAALPPHACCPVAGTRPLQIPAPQEAVRTFAAAVADTLVRTPGAEVLHGPLPYVAALPQPAEHLRTWCDEIAAARAGTPAVALRLAVADPDQDAARAGRLRAELLLVPLRPAATTAAAVGDGAQPVAAGRVWRGGQAGGVSAGCRMEVRRILRQAATVWPPLGALAGQRCPDHVWLEAGQAAALLDSQLQADLAGAGLAVDFPPRLTAALTVSTVVTAHAESDGVGGEQRLSRRLGLAELVDFRWQLALDGHELTPDELGMLAEATRPLVRLRDQWLLLDEATLVRAKRRHIGQLSGWEALTAALTGRITLEGTSWPCAPSDTFARLVDQLRSDASSGAPVPLPPGLTAQLRQYQRRGLTWLARRADLDFGCILADDMGLGKTITAIAFHRHRRAQGATTPTLVVCPASLLTNWAREIVRFSPTTRIRLYHGPGRTLHGLDTDGPDGDCMVITTYGVLQRDRARLAERTWDAVLADEAQALKNPKAGAARAIRTLTAACRVAITGTPVENNFTDLWSLLHFTNPDVFRDLPAFREGYARAAEKDPRGAEAQQLARLITPFVLRRRKADPGIAPELPDKVEHQRIVRLTKDQTVLYEAATREMLAQVAEADGITRRGLIVKLLTILRQICNHPAHLLKQHHPGDQPDQLAAFTDASAKLQALQELLATIDARGESALLFTSYVEMGRLLTAHLGALGHAPLFLHGATPARGRQQLVDAFQAGDSRLLILSIKAGGTGLNLTRAGHVIHYDRPWNPAVEDQATDRAHRIGQDKVVQVHHLLTELTVEDRIASLLAHKRALGEAVLTGGEAALADLDDTQLANLVTLGRPT